MKLIVLLLALLVLGACGTNTVTGKQACVVAMRGAVTASDSVLVGNLRNEGASLIQQSCRSHLRGTP